MATGLFNLKQVTQAIQQKAWSGTQKTPAVDYLVVAGGGGGSSGGGGAGGLLQGSVSVATGSAITVTVGSGGSAGNCDAGSGSAATSGTSSVFGSISATGGGNGGQAGSSAAGTSGGSGGSGGGAAANGAAQYNSGGSGVVGQGNDGSGNNGFSPSPYGVGGGGGAGTAAIRVGATRAYAGGSGTASDITGTRTTYAGGGGGGSYTGTNVGGAGGYGGGGTGSTGNTNNSTAGTANTGGGGGGGRQTNLGSAGGSGIVVVSYPDVYAAATSTTGSPTVSTSGSGSISFNGTNQNLSYATSALFSFGTGDFTAEAWVYKTSNPAYESCIYDARTGNTGTPWALYISQTNYPYFYDGNTYTSSIAISINTWTHVAVSRSSGVLKVFVNGVQGFSATVTTNLDRSAGLNIATDPANTFRYPGYMSNMRIVKGTAVYTTAFTPSTVPLTAVSGTSLLLNSVSGAYLADSSSNALVATAAGSPTWNASSPFTVTGYKNRVYTWTSSGSITF